MNRTIKKGIEITGKCKLSDTDNGISWQHMASSPCNNNKKIITKTIYIGLRRNLQVHGNRHLGKVDLYQQRKVRIPSVTIAFFLSMAIQESSHQNTNPSINLSIFFTIFFFSFFFFVSIHRERESYGYQLVVVVHVWCG